MIRDKENVSIRRRCTNDFIGIAAGADHVSQRFHPGAAIDIGDHVVVFIGALSQKLRQFFGRTRFRQGTAGVEIWQNHALGGINNLGCFRHEMDATE